MKNGFSFWEPYGALTLSWAVLSENVTSGRTESTRLDKTKGVLEAMHAAYDRTLLTNSRAHSLALLAECDVEHGVIQEASKHLKEAFEIAHATGEHFWLAELHRQAGHIELLRTNGAKLSETRERAESQFLKSLAIAREQKAKSLELRAAISLNQLWSSQGKKEDAKELLSSTYNWYSEGFEMVDLRNAREKLNLEL